jgi:energy-coupling factor transporter ATP-binding protein EcfA2
VRAGDRWLLVGTSGSGKTTAAKYLDRALCDLYPFHRHYILDSKHDGDFDKYPGIVKGDMAPARPKSNQRYQVWQPIGTIPDQIERWLWQVRQDAPAFLFIDELVTLCYKRNQYSDEYNILQKTGRSLPVGSITLTQELSKIPGNAYKQSVHRLGFYLDAAAEYDRRICHSLLKAKVEDPVDPYGFHYQHINGRGEPTYFESIQHFLGR